MANKVGSLIKKARTDAGLTQEQLAKKVSGVTASDISKAERGEKELSQAALKEIAKATGVTQSSLLTAAKSSTYSAAKAGGKTTAKTTAAKSSMQLTAAEKRLVELYRKADSDAKKAALKALKGEQEGLEDVLGSLLGNAVELFTKK